MSSTRITIIVLIFSSMIFNASSVAQQKPFIDWDGLHNPFLSYPNWSVKDPAMAYRRGTFYVFFSAFYTDRGQVRSHVVEVSTKDFRQFSQPIFSIDGKEDGWIGMCSPDVQRLYGEYVMTFNSWGNKPGKPDQLFYMTSDDLVHWSHRKTLALNLTRVGNQRVIDVSLAQADGGYYLVYKDQTPGIHARPRIAFSTSLDQPFHYVGNGFPVLLMKDGKDNGYFHENYEFVNTNGEWYLVTTDYLHNSANLLKYDVQAPYLYTLEPGSHWLRWSKGYGLDIPGERFNMESIANAAALYDWRKYDGYYYLIYAGRNDGVTYARRGWNRLALARSKDLVHWAVPSDRP